MSSAGGVRDALTLIVQMEAREKENKSAQEWREKVFDNQEKWRMSNAATAAQNTAFDRRIKLEELELTRGKAKSDQLGNLISMTGIPGLGTSRVGTGGTGGAKKGGKTSFTPQQGAFAVQAIQAEVGPMENLSKQDKKFYQTIYENPNEAAAILDFVEGLREDGNNVNISELGKFINIYGVSKESGNRAATEQVIGDIKDQLLDPNSKYDPNLLLNNFDALTSYVAPVMNWGIKSGAGASASEKEDEYKTALTVMEQQLALEIEKLNSKQRQAVIDETPDVFSTADMERLDRLQGIQTSISLDPNKPQNSVKIKPAELELFSLYGNFSNYSESNELFATARIHDNERKKRDASQTNTLPVRPAPNSSGEPFEPATFDTKQDFEEGLRDVSKEEFNKYNPYVIIGGERLDNPGYTGEPMQGITPDVSQVTSNSGAQQPQPQPQQSTQVPPEVEQDLLEVAQAMQNEDLDYTDFVMIAQDLQEKYPNGEFERLMGERLSGSSSNPIEFTFEKFIQIGKDRENVSN